MPIFTNDQLHDKATALYNARYDNSLYLAATAGKDTDRANALIDAALFYCGSPFHSDDVTQQWDDEESSFLFRFLPPHPPISRSLRQEEIDAIHRDYFIQQVLDAMSGGKTVRFLLHKNNYILFTAKKDGVCRYEFSAGDHNRFSYRLSEFVEQLEAFYDSGLEIIPLVSEAKITVKRATANADAEPDHPSEIRKRLDAKETLNPCAGARIGSIRSQYAIPD